MEFKERLLAASSPGVDEKKRATEEIYLVLREAIDAINELLDVKCVVKLSYYDFKMYHTVIVPGKWCPQESVELFSLGIPDSGYLGTVKLCYDDESMFTTKSKEGLEESFVELFGSTSFNRNIRLAKSFLPNV